MPELNKSENWNYWMNIKFRKEVSFHEATEIIQRIFEEGLKTSKFDTFLRSHYGYYTGVLAVAPGVSHNGEKTDGVMYPENEPMN